MEIVPDDLSNFILCVFLLNEQMHAPLWDVSSKQWFLNDRE